MFKTYFKMKVKRQTRANNERGFAPHKEAEAYAKHYKGAVYIRDDRPCLAVALANAVVTHKSHREGGKQLDNQKKKNKAAFEAAVTVILNHCSTPTDIDDLKS
ncbi:hypothetical protein KC887_04650 [Candidatus Kaiserbacteria bacterium]|nr:hypothetical protein [Candidatus Kaiserbacteria bacterium]